MSIGVDTLPCPAVDEYQQIFLGTDATPVSPTAARIAIGVHTASVAEQAALVAALRKDVANPPNGISATPTGLAVLATSAYDNLVNRAYLLNLIPLLVVGLLLLAVYREARRALLPLVPTALAAGWAPLVLLLLGRLPGGLGGTLGSLNPLTVVLGALIVALGTEFGVVLLSRFYEERGRGLDPDAAAAAALAGVGRAIRVSALTLGAGFAVLALSGLLPSSLPLIADFGFAVLIDLGLAVLAVFGVMLPLAVALERRAPLPAMAPAAATEAMKAGAAQSDPVVRPRPRRRPTSAPHTRGPAPRPTRDPDVGTVPEAAAVTPGLVDIAGFPIRRTLDEFVARRSSVPAATVADLARLQWIETATNLCVVGPAGSGKSHLLIGLGNAAVQAGHRVRYLAAPDLLEMLHAGVADSTVGRVIEGLLANEALLIDDLTFAYPDEQATQLLLRLVGAAYERRSVVVASQTPLQEWAATLPSPAARSLLDRLLHHAIQVTTAIAVAPARRPPPTPSRRRTTKG